MKTQKIGIILLALLMAGMAMVPIVCAVNDGSLENSIGTNENAAIVQPGTSSSLFDQLGLQKPQISGTPVRLKTYDESKDIADKILTQGKFSDASKSVIGLYDFGSTQILLINRKDTVLEAVYDGKTVTTYTLTPVLIGETKESENPKKILNPAGDLGDTYVSTETSTKLYSLKLQSPGGNPSLSRSVSALSTYIVTRYRTDNYRRSNVNWVTCTAKGVFYINYGSSVTSINDQSSYALQYPYMYCGFNSAASGAGSQVGRVNAHMRSGLLYTRVQIDNWVSVDAWLSPNDGGSASTWMSPSPDGCF
jgi:hypothetical protein